MRLHRFVLAPLVLALVTACSACASSPPKPAPPPPAAAAPAPPPPPDARSLYLRGRDALAAGETTLAREAFLAAAEALPTWLLPRLELAELALARREETGPARDALLAFANRGEEGARLYRLIGQLSLDVGDDATAATFLEKALALRPDQPTLRVERAGALERLGRPGDAADEYARALAAAPDDLALRAVLAGALESAGRYDEARAQLEELVSRQPGRESPLRRLARFHERRGDDAAAKEAHRRADRAKGTPAAKRKLRPLLPSKR